MMSKLSKPVCDAVALRDLMLTNNELNDDCGQSLAIMIRGAKCLTRLDISDNSLSDKGVFEICTALPLSKLSHLSFRNNPLTPTAVSYIAGAIVCDVVLTW